MFPPGRWFGVPQGYPDHKADDGPDDSPGHGPVVLQPRGSRLISWYIRHRNEREEQVLEALRKGIGDVGAMVRDIYPKNLNKGLRGGAARNVSAHLAKLVREDRVEVDVRPAVYKIKP